MSDTAIIPIDKIRSMADDMAKSGIFGKTPEQIFSLMLIAQGEGLHPAVAVQEYDIIQGRPAINSRSALARFQAAGGTIQWVERTDKRASAKFYHPQGGELTVTWDMARATQAGLVGKQSWKTYPAQMLSARVIAEGVRAVYPACLSRMYTVEEVQDMEPRHQRAEPRNVTEPLFTPQAAPEATQQDEPVVVTFHEPEDENREYLRSALADPRITGKRREQLAEAVDNPVVPPDELARLAEKARAFLGGEV